MGKQHGDVEARERAVSRTGEAEVVVDLMIGVEEGRGVDCELVSKDLVCIHMVLPSGRAAVLMNLAGDEVVTRKKSESAAAVVVRPKRTAIKAKKSIFEVVLS